MEAKEFIYLAVLGITALFCYWRGFRQGVWRTRRIWKSLLEGTVPPLDELPPPDQASSIFPKNRVLVRGPRAFFASSTVRGSFGKN